MRSAPLLFLIGAVLPITEWNPVEAATVTGRVTFAGRPPQLRDPVPSRHPEVCGSAIADESLRLDDTLGLANVVVTMDGERGPGAVTPDSTLEIRGCRLEPRVQVLAPGQVVAIWNRDPIAHGVRAQTESSDTVFEDDLPLQGQVVLHRVKRPGVVQVASDRGLEWMRAYLFVTATPFATVTDAKGEFRLDNVPPGPRRLRLWHERLGETIRDIEVAAAESVPPLSLAIGS